MTSPIRITTDPASPTRPSLVGGAGSAIWGGQLFDWLDENSKTRGTAWYGRNGQPGWGHKMLSDPHVRRARDSVVDSVIAATWDFEPGDDSPLAEEIADYCRWVFFECLHWDAHLGQAMRAYMRDGFALFEESDDTASIPAARFPSHPGRGTGVVVTGLHFRPAYTVREWRQSPANPVQLRGIVQEIHGSDVERPGQRLVLSDRLVRYTWEQEGAHFEGHPIFRSMWGPWFAKRLLFRIENMSHEKNHMALPFVSLPDRQGTGSEIDVVEEEITKLAAALKNFRANEHGYYVLPGGYTVDFRSGAPGTDIGKTIDRINFDLAYACACGFNLLGNRSKNGAHGLASTLEGQFDISLMKHARFVEGVYNVGHDGWSLVERIVRLNYGGAAPLPRLIARNMPTVDWSTVLPEIWKGVKAGVIKSDDRLEQFSRKVMHAPGIDPARKRRRDESEDIGGDADIQSTLPNGAQVDAAVRIVTAVAQRQISRDAGRTSLAQFFGLSDARAEAMLGDPNFVAAAPTSPAPPPIEDEPEPPPPEDDDEEDEDDADDE